MLMRFLPITIRLQCQFNMDEECLIEFMLMTVIIIIFGQQLQLQQ